MGRPKGSKNKPKEEVVVSRPTVGGVPTENMNQPTVTLRPMTDEEKQEVGASDDAINLVAENVLESVPAIVENPKPQPWEPKPNMGSIQPPKAEELRCGCGHPKATHYGSSTNWCNVSGCKCQRFS